MFQKLGTGSLLLASGVVIGALLTQLIQTRNELAKERDESRRKEEEEKVDEDHNTSSVNIPTRLLDAKHKRDRLPELIILVRHGESQGNADHTLYRSKPDNLVQLTKKGIKQAHRAGKRVEKIFRKMDAEVVDKSQERGEETSQQTTSSSGPSCAAIERVHLCVSPFERTRQTASAMRPWFAHRVVRTNVQPRIREQEFGNLQGTDFQNLRSEQKRVGRFWYRFATGESGADVYDRVKSWWCDYVLNVNERYGYEPVDALVVVTHGLTMRFVLMQLFAWSPQTFHSVWNADNCGTYVLRKDMSKPGMSPYVLDEEAGDMPRSSIDLNVEFNGGFRKIYKLNDYLRIPPPRTMQLDLVKTKLGEQYPEIEKEQISSVLFLPFIDNAMPEKRTRCGRRASLSTLHTDTMNHYHAVEIQNGTEMEKRFHHTNVESEEALAQAEPSWQF